MVAIDSSHEIAPPTQTPSGHTGSIVLFALLLSALVAVASLSLQAGTGNGWAEAGTQVGRFALLLFVAAMVVEPLGRLIPLKPMQAAARERGGLTLGFVTASAVALACELAPMQFGGAIVSAPTIAYCAFTGLILAVLLFSGHPATLRFLGEPAWRAMQRIATAYFWLAFTLTGIEHIVGPHRPDSWPGFSLLLLVAALLIRFADAFVAHYRGGMPRSAR
ncbi:MAG: hypothetical protein WDM91_09645 [Rhizomicrobium sp.]